MNRQLRRAAKAHGKLPVYSTDVPGIVRVNGQLFRSKIVKGQAHLLPNTRWNLFVMIAKIKFHRFVRKYFGNYVSHKA